MPRLTADQLPARYQEQIAAQIYPNETHHHAPAPIAKCPTGHGPLAAGETQTRHPSRYIVSVTSYRVRLLDEDNLCPKYHVDALRYAGLLPSDAPDKAHIITGQIKVSRKEDEKTVIEITP
jgi:hypothetical protein